MDIEHPSARPWEANRNETEAERLDRNWSSLLQELRVAQTGVQLLTGFLLILPFSAEFDRLDVAMRGVYLATVFCSIGATVLLVAPVILHRILFRRHRLKTLVTTSHLYAMAGTLLLGITLAGVATIIFDAVMDRTFAWIAGGVTLLTLGVFWYAIPLLRRRGSQGDPY
ncbi:sodium:proton antiporter [Mycolicibacterium pulveris]|uniref:Sodium:proton antiporter n=1 Tax=Mycolicibacterium pulveris TaxID=36813 RepID=A0A7I7UPQ2_MYCPV|nr:DUF6328 family protein [Mycolicibacterium pulveris]MCV6983491.1 sodium:proton antiporter [Mycolicibacterium pulveris]BBY83368.1 hypothetical protein MPUL_45260 [Mycolicibacterium pulveris]